MRCEGRCKCGEKIEFDWECTCKCKNHIYLVGSDGFHEVMEEIDARQIDDKQESQD